MTKRAGSSTKRRHPLDVDAYFAAVEPPRFTVGTRTYTGRVLSVFEQAAFDRRFARWAVNEVRPEDAHLLREYIEALFPAPARPPDPRTWWQRRPRWLGGWPAPPEPLTPAEVFFALPVAAQLALFEDFARSRLTTVHADGSEPESGPDPRRRPSGSPSRA